MWSSAVYAYLGHHTGDTAEALSWFARAREAREKSETLAAWQQGLNSPERDCEQEDLLRV